MGGSGRTHLLIVKLEAQLARGGARIRVDVARRIGVSREVACLVARRVNGSGLGMRGGRLRLVLRGALVRTARHDGGEAAPGDGEEGALGRLRQPVEQVFPTKIYAVELNHSEKVIKPGLSCEAQLPYLDCASSLVDAG